MDGLSPTVADRNASIEQVKKLYELFCKCDCTLLEVTNMILLYLGIIFLVVPELLVLAQYKIPHDLILSRISSTGQPYCRDFR